MALQRKTPWSSVFLLGLSLFSSLMFLSGGVLMFVAGLTELLSGDTVLAQSTLTLSASSLFLGMLLWPAVYYSLMSVLDRPAKGLPLHRIPTSLLATIWIIISVLVLWLGKTSSLSIFLIPFNLLTLVLPIWIFARLGTRGISAGSPQRRWGTVTVGMTIVPLLIGALEILAILVILVTVVFWLATNPSVMNEIEALSARLIYTRNADVIYKILSPYLFNPVVIFIILGFFSICIPLIEELLKPLGVWFNGRKPVSSEQGFALGVLGGAAYALVESLGVSPGVSGMANMLSLARAGTDILHITTAGLMGWALVNSWQHRKFLQLGLVYIIVVTLHGMWNALSLAIAAGNGISYLPTQSPYLENLPVAAIGGLIVLTLVNLAILIGANQRVRIDMGDQASQPINDNFES